ncbi:quinolinate synthase NadA [candidate division KSB1 bacterium]|nr:quinolinate synthase NadA [candidate division KSB1 bacterium]
MPFLDHLEELRWRIIKSIISVLLCTIGVYVFSEPFMEILVHPYITARPDDVGGLVYLGPTGGFMVYLEISLFGGIVLSLPVIFYQLWQFVAPGLYKRERKYTLGVIIISTISFFIGATFSYSVIIPLGLNFLLGYKTTFLAPSLTIDKYLSFILMLLLVSGLVFELPLVTFFLTKLGLISAKFMREKRRYAIVIVLIVAAILTPPDVMTQLLLAGPIVVLYEISILVSAIVGRKRRKKEAAEAASPDESHHAQEQSAAEAAAAESEPQREMPETIAATPDISDGKMKADKPKEAESNPQDIMATLAASDLLPDSYKDIPIAELNRRIVKIKRKYGSELAILGHHYQRDEIIAHSDIRGDSFALSKKASELAEAKTIVFCGVKFMAEAACILARPNQIVLHPDFNAGCPLADFADIDKVEEAWDTLISICRSDTITPITYMNSSSEIKAFCGRKSGTVCTSSNAPKAFQWGLEQSNKVFFFPDQHLGENTASKLNLQYYDYVIWDPAKDLGGNSEEAIRNAKLILWKGHCHVHTFFTEKHVQKMRKAYPDAKIVVHPECKKSVVDLVDANGSTDFIINYAKNAPLHSTIIVGTEINLVTRLQRENPDKTIIPLARSLCPNMYKINLQNLYWTLDNLGDVNAVYVEPGIIKDARIALNRMLEIAK